MIKKVWKGKGEEKGKGIPLKIQMDGLGNDAQSAIKRDLEVATRSGNSRKSRKMGFAQQSQDAEMNF